MNQLPGRTDAEAWRIGSLGQEKRWEAKIHSEGSGPVCLDLLATSRTKVYGANGRQEILEGGLLCLVTGEVEHAKHLWCQDDG